MGGLQRTGFAAIDAGVMGEIGQVFLADLHLRAQGAQQVLIFRQANGTALQFLRDGRDGRERCAQLVGGSRSENAERDDALIA